jgi:hypothetical protein
MSGDTWGVKWGRFVKLNLAKTEFPTLLTTMQAKLNGTAAEPKDNLTTAQPEGWIEDPVYSEDDLTVISYKDVDDYIGMVTRVRGKIVSTKNTGKAIYLNFDENWKKYLTVVFFANDLPDFEDKPEEFYLNKTIIVTGRVKQYHGKPEIVISSGEQIELVKE